MNTINKPSVTLPSWVFNIGLTVFFAMVTTWGMLTATKAVLEYRVNSNTKSIEILNETTVKRAEFEAIKSQLNRIEDNLNIHIRETDK